MRDEGGPPPSSADATGAAGDRQDSAWENPSENLPFALRKSCSLYRVRGLLKDVPPQPGGTLHESKNPTFGAL